MEASACLTSAEDYYSVNHEGSIYCPRAAFTPQAGKKSAFPSLLPAAKQGSHAQPSSAAHSSFRRTGQQIPAYVAVNSLKAFLCLIS